MNIGLTFDLKEKVFTGQGSPEAALEEYDSPETVNGISAVLESLGHSVVRLGCGSEFLENVRKSKVDMVFNIAEGLGHYRSREAQVPSVLEMLEIPYVGSDPLCLAVSLDKPLTKKIIKALEIPTPDWRVISSLHELHKVDWHEFSFPGFVKPAQEGSSKGGRLNSRVDTSHQAVEMIERLLKDYRQPVMIKEFFGGEEVKAGVSGNSA